MTVFLAELGTVGRELSWNFEELSLDDSSEHSVLGTRGNRGCLAVKDCFMTAGSTFIVVVCFLT